MSEFTKRPLQLLDGIYRFVGGLRGVNRVDLTSDITLVHDLSRQAEKNGTGGYFGRIDWRETFSPNGTLEEIITRPADVGPLLQLDESEYELWILAVEANIAFADIGDYTSIGFIHGCEANSQRFQNHLGSNQPTYQVFSYHTAFVSSTNSTGTAKASAGEVLPMPVRTYPNGFIAIQGVTTAATTTDFTFDMWAGPPGSTPPGVA